MASIDLPLDQGFSGICDLEQRRFTKTDETKVNEILHVSLLCLGS